MKDAGEAQNDDLIDRYLNDQLSESERSAFELMLMQDSQLFARVQLLDAFKTALVEESAALRSKHKPLQLPFRSWLQQPMSLAASVLVAGLGLQVMKTAFTEEPVPQDGIGVSTVFLLEVMRGGNTPVLSGTAPYLFQIDAGPGAAGLVAAVSLRDAEGKELLHVNDLEVDASGWVRVVFNQPLSGAYSVELFRLDNLSSQRFDITITD